MTPLDRRSTSARRLGYAIVILGALFIALAAFIALHPRPTALDRTLDHALLAQPGSVPFDVFRVVTFTGSAAAIAVAGVIIAVTGWIWTKDTRLSLICVVGLGLAGIGELVVKHVVARARPATEVFTGESGFSFPSGHTTGATALAVVVIVIAYALAPRRRTRTIVIVGASVYAIVIGVSRVIVGAHYATDVVGGLVLGSTVAIAVTVVVLRMSTRALNDSNSS